MSAETQAREPASTAGSQVEQLGLELMPSRDASIVPGSMTFYTTVPAPGPVPTEPLRGPHVAALLCFVHWACLHVATCASALLCLSLSPRFAQQLHGRTASPEEERPASCAVLPQLQWLGQMPAVPRGLPQEVNAPETRLPLPADASGSPGSSPGSRT